MVGTIVGSIIAAIITAHIPAKGKKLVIEVSIDILPSIEGMAAICLSSDIGRPEFILSSEFMPFIGAISPSPDI